MDKRINIEDEHTDAPEDWRGILDRAAWMLEIYSAHLYKLSPIDFDEHPYIPSIGEVVEKLRKWLTATPPATGETAESVPVPTSADMAQLMLGLGLNYLQHHAPERLKPEARIQSATGETEDLPPLPEPQTIVTERMGIRFSSTAWSDIQMRKFGRDAIAHYLRKQASQVGAPSSAPTAGQSIDTADFRILLDNWAGALHSCDHRTRTVYAKQAYNALIAHIDTWAGAAPAAGNTAQREVSTQE